MPLKNSQITDDLKRIHILEYNDNAISGMISQRHWPFRIVKHPFECVVCGGGGVCVLFFG